MEHFWDLKIGKYVELLTPVSFTSCELLYLTSTAGRASRVFLAYVVLWINKDSLALYIARIAQCATTDRSEVWKLYCAVELVPVTEASKLVSIEVESQSQTPSLGLRRLHAALCTHHIDDLLHHYHYMFISDNNHRSHALGILANVDKNKELRNHGLLQVYSRNIQVGRKLSCYVYFGIHSGVAYHTGLPV
jgi:hypothetical protein